MTKKLLSLIICLFLATVSQADVLGKYKLHWEISNSPGNIAAGKSKPDRPAVLGEYTHDYFIYNDANDCGYGFSAHFFKKFVVIKSITGFDTFGCFGHGVTFQGVYIKVKQ